MFRYKLNIIIIIILMNYKENLIKSNDEIIKLIKLNKPFSVIRLGIGGETYMTYEYNLTNQLKIIDIGN